MFGNTSGDVTKCSSGSRVGVVDGSAEINRAKLCCSDGSFGFLQLHVR